MSWDSVMVSNCSTDGGADVTTAAFSIPTLPQNLIDAGWQLEPEGGPAGWYIATHPEHGQTTSSYLYGNRPDISMRQMVKRIKQLDPSNGLKPTNISNQLTAINDAFSQLELQADALRANIETYNRNRCNGRAVYRTAKSGTVFLYAHHTAGVDCPTCGSHPEGKRLRKYIGEEQTVTADNALIAMSYQGLWEKARQELDTVQQKLQRVERLIWQLELTFNGRMVSS